MPNSHSRPAHTHHRVVFSDLQSCSAPGLISIEGPEAQHLAKVKRVRIGESIGVLDGRGAMGIGELVEITGSKQRPIVAILLEKISIFDHVSPRVQICCPVPKGDRLERMIDQLTQIGVHSWVPLICERSERDPESVRPDRIQRIISEACKQCIRVHALAVEEPMPFSDAIIPQPDQHIAFCDSSGSDALSSVGQSDRRILIGPEGGWTDDERLIARDHDVCISRLGVHTLRLETAAVAAASLALAGASTQIMSGDSQ